MKAIVTPQGYRFENQDGKTFERGLMPGGRSFYQRHNRLIRKAKKAAAQIGEKFERTVFQWRMKDMDQ